MNAGIVTLIALVIGDRGRLADELGRFLFDLKYYLERHAEVRLCVAIDGPSWHAACAAHGFDAPRLSVVVSESESHHPGVLLNRALTRVDTSFVGILAIGAEVSTWFANREALIEGAQRTGAAIAAGYRGCAETRTDADESFLVSPEDKFSIEYPHAWLQMLDLVPHANSAISVGAVRAAGGFTEVAALQRMWWWEFCLRIARHAPIASLRVQPVNARSWHRYPFAVETAASVGDNLRALLRVQSDRGRTLPIREDEFAVPLADDARNAAFSSLWRALDPPLAARLCAAVARRGRPLRVTVLGGINEPAHNQLCFFNYFEHMAEWGAITWQSVLDERADAETLRASDLAIFCRVRSDRGTAMIDRCRDLGVPSLYVLDDNWFWLGRDWQAYAEIFVPGARPYENFMHCVRHADMALVYNPFLAADLSRHARRVAILPPNVDLRHFARRQSAHPRLRIGYVGSLRKNEIAFDALVEVIRSRDDIDLFVMSSSLPPAFSALPPERVHFASHRFSYAEYAATVGEAAPDILVAPVGRTRFEASKCPNKYLEISAAGAAGIYSRAEPYLSYVEEDETGLFAGDKVGEWRAALERLIDDAALRQQIAANALAHVRAHFETSAVLPRFLAVLLDAIEGHGGTAPR